MSVARQFGANLCRLRERSGITQEDLAFRAALHRTEIGLLERGGRTPRIATLAKLAGSLDVDSAALLAGIIWEAGEIRRGSFIGTIDDSSK